MIPLSYISPFHQFFMDKITHDKPDDQPEGKRQCKLSDKPVEESAPESTKELIKELAKKITTEDEHTPEPKTDEEFVKEDAKEKAAKERLHDKYYDGNKLYPRWIIFHGQKTFLSPPWDDGQYYYSPREFRGMWPWQIRRKDEDKEIY